MQTTQNTVTQAQALQHCAQQLEYVTQTQTLCLDTAEEIAAVVQQLVNANANFASIVAATRYSNDEVNESKYL